MIITIDGSL